MAGWRFTAGRLVARGQGRGQGRGGGPERSHPPRNNCAVPRVGHRVRDGGVSQRPPGERQQQRRRTPKMATITAIRDQVRHGNREGHSRSGTNQGWLRSIGGGSVLSRHSGERFHQSLQGRRGIDCAEL